MKTQRVLALAKKDLKKTVREPAVLFMIFLFPVVLTLAFGTSFGAVGGGQPTTFQIGVVNIDMAGQWSPRFIDSLKATKILNVQMYANNQTAQFELVQGKVQAVILIPGDFGASIDSFVTNPYDPKRWVNTTVPMYLDGGSIFATQAITPIVQQVLASVVDGKQQAMIQGPIQLGNPSLVNVQKKTAFDYMAPGLFAFASIFLIMIVSGSFTDDRESGMLRRIRVTPTSSAEFMTSQVLSNMIVVLIQGGLVFAMAYAVGFRPDVSTASFALAFAIVMIFSLCNVGFGLITATLARSSGAATGISFIFVLPQMFLGTFVGAALSSAAQAAGKFVPSYYVTDALTSLLLRGAPISSPTVLLDTVIVSVFSVAVLIVGILLFGKFSKS